MDDVGILGLGPIRYYNRSGNPITVQELERLDRLVEQTDLDDGRQVSTVLIGIDMRPMTLGGERGVGPPLIFESLVFGPVETWHGIRLFRHTLSPSRRSATESEAKLGHQVLVREAREGQWKFTPWKAT